MECHNFMRGRCYSTQHRHDADPSSVQCSKSRHFFHDGCHPCNVPECWFWHLPNHHVSGSRVPGHQHRATTAPINCTLEQAAALLVEDLDFTADTPRAREETRRLMIAFWERPTHLKSQDLNSRYGALRTRVLHLLNQGGATPG